MDGDGVRMDFRLDVETTFVQRLVNMALSGTARQWLPVDSVWTSSRPWSWEEEDSRALRLHQLSSLSPADPRAVPEVVDASGGGAQEAVVDFRRRHPR